MQIPESCMAGSQLENLEFEVVNSKGDVDVSFNDEDKIGQSHTLVIKALSEFVNIDESVKYVFREGRCIVRAVPIPSEEGDFNFVVAHSLHSELQLTVKVWIFGLNDYLIIFSCNKTNYLMGNQKYLFTLLFYLNFLLFYFINKLLI